MASCSYTDGQYTWTMHGRTAEQQTRKHTPLVGGGYKIHLHVSLSRPVNETTYGLLIQVQKDTIGSFQVPIVWNNG